MQAPLIPIQIESCYTNRAGDPLFLHSSMALATPDTATAMRALDAELRTKGGRLVLSDLFRSYAMQYHANQDYFSGKKTAYSPPPGGSLHEAGRAMDIDLSKINMPLTDFWTMARKYHFSPIIDTPDVHLNEAWHFECRGSHAKVYDYYQSGKGTNMPSYTAMAVSAILSLRIPVDRFSERSKEALIQCALIRLGYDIGEIDGILGEKTHDALREARITSNLCEAIMNELEGRLQLLFPDEYTLSATGFQNEANTN
jgi:hypothetical protein